MFGENKVSYIIVLDNQNFDPKIVNISLSIGKKNICFVCSKWPCNREGYYFEHTKKNPNPNPSPLDGHFEHQHLFFGRQIRKLDFYYARLS